MSGSAESSLETSDSGEQKRLLPAGDVAILHEKEPQQWGIKEVATWLQHIGFEKVAPLFVDEMISGEELLQLDGPELTELGVLKMGQRKRLIHKIAKLKSRGLAAMDEETSSSIDNSGSSSADAITITANLRKRKVTFTTKATISRDDLIDKLSDEFGIRIKLRFVDDDGDVINVNNDAVLRDIMMGEDSVTFQCSKDLKAAAKSKANKTALQSRANAMSKQFSMFDTLMDGYIVIDGDGIVMFFNKTAEKMFGYPRNKVLGKNIKMLMPDSYARKHDHYLARYATTGKKHIVDSRRVVMAKDSADGMFAVELAITENKNDDGSSHFVGTLKPAASDDTSSGNAAEEETGVPAKLRSQLNRLEEGAICIDQTGTICLINAAAEKMFGYTAAECMKKKIEMLMPSPHKENHAYYLQRYVATGKKRVMGGSRNVTALHKNGSALPINLALSETTSADDEPLFIGLLTTAKTVPSKKNHSVMQMTRKLLNSMTVPGVLINEKGIIHAFNRSAEELLGYQLLDVVGRNVSMLMNDTDAHQHDGYLSHYLSTGEEKVIGKERVVQAKHKSGQIIPIHLSVTVTEDENKNKLFTGMMHQPRDELEKKRKSKKKKSKRKSSHSSSDHE